jgi:hypothetical protein
MVVQPAISKTRFALLRRVDKPETVSQAERGAETGRLLAYRAQPRRPVTQRTDRVDRAENCYAFSDICRQIRASAPRLPCVRSERMRSCWQNGAGAGILG